MEWIEEQIKYWTDELNKVDFNDKKLSLVELMRPYTELNNLYMLKMEILLKNQIKDGKSKS